MEKRLKAPCYSTDVLARKLWLTLVRDFRSSLDNSFCLRAEGALLADAAQHREYVYPELGNVSIARFKRYKQMEALLKKYRFAQDAFSDEELEKVTLSKYFTEQERLSKPIHQNQFSLVVFQRARAIARSILGEFTPEDAVVRCKFGKKSSIGCSLNLAYIDEKLSSASAFTGSSQCSKWFFRDVLPDDEILKELVSKIGIKPNDSRLEHDSLNLINVPKTWKVLRTITPLTLLSLFYSNGVGSIVTERLQTAGLDIRRLQNRHRHLVKGFSKSKTHATADLSAASDSLTKELLNRVLPRKWYSVIKPVMTHQVCFKQEGVSHAAYTSSVLPMGNGLTFPVETLIFYCLIRALGDLTGVKGIYSVYGDDLIYPSKLHPYVVRFFPYAGLVLNLDKTFVKYPFRESCGADFYRGADVRPFYLQGQSQVLTSSKYQAFLYKTYNGLVRRWDPLEIRQTLLFLLTELVMISREILRVPPDYPDTAGIKTSSPHDIPLDLANLPLSPIFTIVDSWGNSEFSFKYLAVTPQFRLVKTVLPYYWLALQGETDEVESYNGTQLSSIRTNLSPARSSLTWRRAKRTRSYSNQGRKIVKKIVKYIPSVASRVSEHHRIRNDGSIMEWI